jgi:hypothetical protein
MDSSLLADVEEWIILHEFPALKSRKRSKSAPD